MTSEEHEQFRSVVRDFAQREVAPFAAQWDIDCRFPIEVVRKMGEMGLFGLIFPEEWGGGGGDFTSLCIAIEELGRADQSIGITLSAGVGLGINPIYTYGSDEQKQMFLPDLVSGRALGAFALTEPDGGSDAGATATRATHSESLRTWQLNGSKSFITNSGTEITSVITTTARTDDGAISAFLVPAGTPGLVVEPSYRKLGWHASDTHGLSFIDCVIPEENLLGERGKGFHNFLTMLDGGRVAISALALGLSQTCLDLSVEYAKTRNAFGGAIGRFQSISFALADLAVSVENSRNLTYKAAMLKDQGKPFRDVAAMAKLYSTESAVEATRLATQVFGGSGFIEDLPIARFYRDAKVLEIGEGTSEIQRLVIARSLGLPVG
ncbi:MAG: acyl-CoA dehydrogenase family protein [Actinomycetota bacterium]